MRSAPALCCAPAFICYDRNGNKMTDDNVKLKNDISVYRERLGLTQGELALKCGVRRETIVNLERGRYNPSLRLALRICTELGSRVEELFWLEREAGGIFAEKSSFLI